jgi:hypothetical protein
MVYTPWLRGTTVLLTDWQAVAFEVQVISEMSWTLIMRGFQLLAQYGNAILTNSLRLALPASAMYF